MIDKKNATDLLPCSHCGGQAEIKRNKTVLVQCTVCSAATFQIGGDPDSAISAWNRRAQLAKEEPVKLKFPTTLRKMWSGGEVQEWLNGQPPMYHRPTPAAPADQVEYEIWIGDCLEAGISGPPAAALIELNSYAAQYAEDGPLNIFEVTRQEIAVVGGVIVKVGAAPAVTDAEEDAAVIKRLSNLLADITITILGEEEALKVDLLNELPKIIAEKMLEAALSAQLLVEYEEVRQDQKRLVRELDVALNGEAGAAKQASLCDIVGQVRRTRTRIATLPT